MADILQLLVAGLATGGIYALVAIGFVLLVGTIGISVWSGLPPAVVAKDASTGTAYGITKFSVSFLNEYWLHFELTSVLLVAAVVAALAVIKVSRRPRHG